MKASQATRLETLAIQLGTSIRYLAEANQKHANHTFGKDCCKDSALERIKNINDEEFSQKG